MNIAEAFSSGAGVSHFNILLVIVILLLLIVFIFSSSLSALGQEISRGEKDKGFLFKNILFIIVATAIGIAILLLFSAT